MLKGGLRPPPDIEAYFANPVGIFVRENSANNLSFTCTSTIIPFPEHHFGTPGAPGGLKEISRLPGEGVHETPDVHSTAVYAGERNVPASKRKECDVAKSPIRLHICSSTRPPAVTGAKLATPRMCDPLHYMQVNAT